MIDKINNFIPYEKGENMDSEKGFDLIDKMLEDSDNSYYIDFVPFTFQSEDYSRLEAYLNKHYKLQFANKIKFITFAIIYYYDSYVYLDERVVNALYPDLKNKDLRILELEKLANIIDSLIIDDYSGLNILFKDKDHFSLLRIEDGFDTYLFDIEGHTHKNIESLVEHQGLYLKSIH